MGFCIICGFGHLLGVWNMSSMDEAGLLSFCWILLMLCSKANSQPSFILTSQQHFFPVNHFLPKYFLLLACETEVSWCFCEICPFLLNVICWFFSSPLSLNLRVLRVQSLYGHLLFYTYSHFVNDLIWLWYFRPHSMLTMPVFVS